MLYIIALYRFNLKELHYNKYLLFCILHKIGTALSPRICRAIATFLNVYFSHGSATTSFRNGDKCFIYVLDNSLMFSTVKGFSKAVSS